MYSTRVNTSVQFISRSCFILSIHNQVNYLIFQRQGKIITQKFHILSKNYLFRRKFQLFARNFTLNAEFVLNKDFAQITLKPYTKILRKKCSNFAKKMHKYCTKKIAQIAREKLKLQMLASNFLRSEKFFVKFFSGFAQSFFCGIFRAELHINCACFFKINFCAKMWNSTQKFASDGNPTYYYSFRSI